MLDPHLKAAVSATLQRDILPSGQSVTLRARLIPGQPGTALCSCWDSVGKRVTQPDDPQCFGTGVVGGYEAGVVEPIAIYPGAASTTVQNPAGYLETQTVDVAYVMPTAPTLKARDLLIVSPDPLGVPGNPDRRYLVGDETDPLSLGPTVLVRRYYVHPAELGSIVYRVPMANPATIPNDAWGTL